jgi:hypothetical protein
LLLMFFLFLVILLIVSPPRGHYFFGHICAHATSYSSLQRLHFTREVQTASRHLVIDDTKFRTFYVKEFSRVFLEFPHFRPSHNNQLNNTNDISRSSWNREIDHTIY